MAPEDLVLGLVPFDDAAIFGYILLIIIKDTKKSVMASNIDRHAYATTIQKLIYNDCEVYSIALVTSLI